MNRQIQQELQDTIESLMDVHGLGNVLGAIGKVCEEKADHLRSNWQDPDAAKAWERMARKLEAPESQAHRGAL